MSGNDDLAVYADLTHSVPARKTGRIIIEEADPEHGLMAHWYSFTPDELRDFIGKLESVLAEVEELGADRSGK